MPWAYMRVHISLGSTAFSRAALEPAFRGSLASLGTHGRWARAPAMMARNLDCICESATTNYRRARRNCGLAGPPAVCKGPAGGVEPEQDGARIQVHAGHRDCRSHADRRLRPDGLRHGGGSNASSKPPLRDSLGLRARSRGSSRPTSPRRAASASSGLWRRARISAPAAEGVRNGAFVLCARGAPCVMSSRCVCRAPCASRRRRRRGGGRGAVAPVLSR